MNCPKPTCPGKLRRPNQEEIAISLEIHHSQTTHVCPLCGTYWIIREQTIPIKGNIVPPVWAIDMKEIKKEIKCSHLKYSGKPPKDSIWCERDKETITTAECRLCYRKVNKAKGLEAFM